MGAWFDLFRIVTASALFFWAMPFLSRRVAGDQPVAWEKDFVPAFVRAALVFQVTGITLGSWGLAFAGAVFGVIACWIAIEVTFSSAQRHTMDPLWWRTLGVRIAVWIESRAWEGAPSRVYQRLPSISTPWASGLAVLAIVSMLGKVGFPLLYRRFLDIDSYARAISLHHLVAGAEWSPDGSVAFLLPLAQFSGVDVAGVIRWTGPLFLTGILLALAHCGWTWTGSLAGAFLPPLLFEGYQHWMVIRPAGEATAGEIAAFFWLLSAGLLRTSRLYALGAVLLALSAKFTIPAVLAPILAALMLGAGLAWLGRFLPFALTARKLVTAILLSGLIVSMGGAAAPKDGPVQYEAAARTAARIAGERPRNRYLVVSPTQESVALYGRGWHEELADFVRRFERAIPMPADFRFPYSTPEVFVFVEKEPLGQPTFSPASTFDTNSYYYYTRLGRTSLQFQAARIMASYARSHPDCSIYYEDDVIMVYRFEPPDQRAN